ncbi:multicopper oxidase family protein [Sinosporangium siamense]|uniref:Multicopper oxidase with three cupredoxin domains (Includes cell division protein FtsP and spore coat protein CotA) n=1 Tax=Sinosporangium siamense TaxID=1367973 RepID=A0A919RRA4_9ACTN|nr:multicopper oxidase family protein [Sinosporangium siamense]GII97289.1 hypothetical protein Ssi02_75200 [Sinosporangium siamense]
MVESLFLTDLVLAFLLAVTGVLLGRRAGRHQMTPGASAVLRRFLYATTAVVAARVVVAVMLLVAGGWEPAAHRFLLGLPVVALPLAWTWLRPHPIAGHVTAMGALTSFYVLYVPPGPQDMAIAVLAAITVLGMTGAASLLLGIWRSGNGRLRRMPWLSGVAVLAVAASVGALFMAAQPGPDVHASVRDWGGGAEPAPAVAAPQAAGGHHGGAAPVARPVAADPAAARTRSVDELTGPRDREPDVRFTLTAAKGVVRLASGKQVEALTFNGTSPGPELRVRHGELVEVTLINRDVAEGVTLHWHGIDVANAEDGVPGVTQNAGRPGKKHVYRFVPDRAGTYWYHTHRDANRSIERGLFGALIVEGDDTEAGFIRNVFTHQWPGEIAAFGTADVPEGVAVAPDTPVTLRLINSSKEPHRLMLGGTPYKVTALDGNPINRPGDLKPGTDLLLAAGGRYDVSFTMPAGPVTLRLDTAEAPNPVALTLSSDGKAAPAELTPGELFDRIGYGKPDVPVDSAPYQRDFQLVLDNGLGFSGGAFTWSNTINGRLWPAVPTLMVREGDKVRMVITSRGIGDHPMHLHGHRVRVLSRNGTPVTGSAWWADTINVAPGESYEITFTANNPGIWMDHCHDFDHAEAGMVMHLAYEGVTSPYHGDGH